MATKPEPFNLTLFKSGRQAITREGKRASYMGEIPESEEGLVVHVKGEMAAWHYYRTGQYRLTGDSVDDLIAMAPEEVTLYVNVYQGKHRYSTSRAFLTENAAKASQGGERHPQYLRTIAVTFEA